jgi:mRNA interferase MazF
MATRPFIPQRKDVVWLDFEPAKGKKIGKYRPVLVLSSREYNRKTGLLICCPVSTSIRGGTTEVPLSRMDNPSVVAASLVQTLSWKERKIKKITTAKQSEFEETLIKLLPLLGANDLIESFMKRALTP